MKAILALIALTGGSMLGSIAARAHESPVPHEHPHLHTVDGALLGYDTMALAALALLVATGVGLVLARRRK